MVSSELEAMLRKVVREELKALLAAGLTTAEAVPAVPVVLTQTLEEYVASFAHPYSLSERELRQAESLMSPEEAAIYRKRCYAWRASQGGNEKGARLMRSQADKLEQALMARRAAA